MGVRETGSVIRSIDQTKLVNYERSKGSHGAELAQGSGIKNLLTIDVEDYFQVNVFSHRVGFDRWEEFEARVERNTLKILSILNRAGVKATFFVLGWIAERSPELIREIDRQGHEVASHGYRHLRVDQQTPTEFRNDIRIAKEILENTIDKPVYGYRAPTYSIVRRSLWALKILAEEGYRYDSSVFPVRHDVYGIPSAPRVPFWVHACPNNPSRLEDIEFSAFSYSPACGSASIPSEGILELPLATIRILGNNFPIAGGGYLRLLPYWFIRWGLGRINRQGNLFVFYLHPWEVDPAQPRIDGISRLSKLRHYHNLDKTEQRFWRILSDFSFTSIRSVFLEVD